VDRKNLTNSIEHVVNLIELETKSAVLLSEKKVDGIKTACGVDRPFSPIFFNKTCLVITCADDYVTISTTFSGLTNVIQIAVIPFHEYIFVINYMNSPLREYLNPGEEA